MAEKITIDQLNRIYQEAESADREVFAEMRSNVLLVSGEHYHRRGMRTIHQRIQSRQDLSDFQKLRLTQNITHKVARRYVAQIGAHAPGVTVLPQRENELQDQKTAEINRDVMEDAKARYKWREKRRRHLRDFVELGETCLKIFWDPSAGDFVGYEQRVNEAGEPEFDMAGAPVADEERPVFKGAFVFERIFGMNLLRKVGGTSMEGSECWIVRKMVAIDDLKKKYREDSSKLKLLSEDAQDDFIVFDSDRVGYRRENGQVLIREFYWPRSQDYPEGWFSITTKTGILEEGPLPFGIFPLVWKGFDEFATTCRGRSIIKQVRPFQAEINRAASACAMQQVTLGDDKVLYQAGSKLAQGSLLPGVRGIAYAGIPPTVLPGRDGSHYDNYVDKQIARGFGAVDMDEENEDKAPDGDPYAQLFKSLKDSKRYSEYGEKFEEFEVEAWELFLNLARKYYDDDMYIVAAGRSERVNIAEFRNSSPLSYKIKIEPRAETPETQFGKQLTLNHVLQYVGPNMDKKDIGRVVSAMPFANVKEAFSHMTLDYEAIKNDMLRMERGEWPPFGKYDDDEYALRELSARTRKADFEFLPPRVQELYERRIAMHEESMAMKMAEAQAAKDGFIPTDGAMIAVDMYVPNPAGPEKPAKRVRIPYGAINWLVNRLTAQGKDLETLETQNQGVIAEMAAMIANGERTLPPAPPRPGPAPMGSSAFAGAPTAALGVS